MKPFFQLLIHCLAVIFVHGGAVFAQVPVKATDGQSYRHAWSGGMNSCQFGRLDINRDGRKDLVVFDRTGNRILPFVNNGSGGADAYDFAPEYVDRFPLLSDWAIFLDYDGDGREDIFTYSPGFAGLKVYKNVSESQLEFRLQVYPFLTSFQGGGYVNILVTYADYPGIVDLDGDGDLDILTFYGLGSFVELHRNMSVEKYGHRDSLDFMRTSYCWGFFAESEESNQLTLDTCLGWMGPGAPGVGSAKDWRHTGSTFRVMDLDGDGLLDLLLGDVDYPNLVALFNGGTADTARMTHYDWEYPPGADRIRLFSMPSAFYDDIDGDGVKDLLVSPFDPNPFISENFNSTWFYRNDGTNDQPQFSLRSRAFLQEEMIDVGAGAYPVLFDYDLDGLDDLFIANYGYYDTSYYDEYLTLYTEHSGKLALLRNTGTAEQPAFTWIDRDYAGISALGLRGGIPAFGDLDGDGDADMLVGREDGKLVVYYNTAQPGEPMQMVFGQLSYQDIDVGSYSAPQLFDLDNDGLVDLVIGERLGNLNFYRNTGTVQQPVFTFVTDSLGKVNVTDYNVSLNGFSVPFFYRDAGGEVHLLVGSEQGKVFYYRGIDGTDFISAYEESDGLAGLIGMESLKADRGYRSAAALADLSGDGVPELIIGNFSGGLEFFGTLAPPAVSGLPGTSAGNNPVKIFPRPAGDQLNVTAEAHYDIIRVEIRDLSGRTLLSRSDIHSHACSMDLSGLPGGAYLITLTLKERTSGKWVLIREKMLKIS